MDRKKLGIFAEGVAAHYLLKKGYKILARNYKFNFGEIDIVAQKDDVIIFCEVKALGAKYSGFDPEMRVDFKKKNKLLKLATAFLQSKRLQEKKSQIDIISVIFDRENKKAHIKHFKNAFQDY